MNIGLDLQWHDLAGLLGVACVLVAFFGLQAGRLRGDALPYQLLNLVGAVAMAISLLYAFNLSSMVIQLAWIAISLYGMVRSHRLRRAGKDAARS